jgi:hypothetical protein
MFKRESKKRREQRSATSDPHALIKTLMALGDVDSIDTILDLIGEHGSPWAEEHAAALPRSPEEIQRDEERADAGRRAKALYGLCARNGVPFFNEGCSNYEGETVEENRIYSKFLDWFAVDAGARPLKKSLWKGKWKA